tara:strand:+ start:9046 stop:10329 length:1284 start_codon:yes stop_codon:yes gene_type:complete
MKKYNIGIIGLGYVGLPLAVEFAKKYSTIGFDINSKRVEELNNYVDSTLEIDSSNLKSVIKNNINDGNLGLFLTSDREKLINCNVYIITVPTPINEEKKPDFGPLISATESISNLISKDDIVIYESTVYPGATEEICVPIIEKISGLKLNEDFYVGYSPERINPGDKDRTLTKILKITSGSNQRSSVEIDNLYNSIIDAGTYLAKSIKVAEAAKVIENSQRDINIAFVNELAIIFNKLNIDTNDVLEAAGTKWNFLKFKPGLVGGHCIGVDPYYLAEKAVEVGYDPNIILSGRRLNDSMGKYVANQLIKFISKNKEKVEGSSVLVLGLTFKENCPDIRNTKVIDMIYELQDFGLKITVMDPWADKDEVKSTYGISIIDKIDKSKYDSIVLAVAHNEFLSIDYDQIKNDNGFIYDLKGILKNQADYRL